MMFKDIYLADKNKENKEQSPKKARCGYLCVCVIRKVQIGSWFWLHGLLRIIHKTVAVYPFLYVCYVAMKMDFKMQGYKPGGNNLPSPKVF
jgi:DNA phosphorothioation-dependent restriction protein DptG